jgi:hypothetical protein
VSLRRTLLCAAVAAALLPLGQSVAGSSERQGHRFRTTRTFQLAPGQDTRTFAFRERSGVVLLNRLTVLHGVRAFVTARIPHLAGAEVWSWPLHGDPTLSCRRRGGLDVCTQEEEWCPMPETVWRFHLVKLGGPAGRVRFDFVVAPPPSQKLS